MRHTLWHTITLGEPNELGEDILLDLPVVVFDRGEVHVLVGVGDHPGMPAPKDADKV